MPDVPLSPSSRPDFADTPDVEFWLRDKPAEWGVALAVRVALRTLPLALPASSENNPYYSQRNRRAAVFAFRAAFVSATGLGHHRFLEATRYARGDRDALKNLDLPAFNAAAAAAGAAAVAASIHDAGQSGPSSATFAATAALLAGGEASLIFESISADADFLQKFWKSPGENPTSTSELQVLRWKMPRFLMSKPLWLTDVKGSSDFVSNFPDWIRRPFDAFEQTPLVFNGPWGVWLEWYRRALAGFSQGYAFGHDQDSAIALKLPEFWDRKNPDDVMTDIAALAKWRWNGRKNRSEKTKRENSVSSAVAPGALIQKAEAQSDEATDEDRLGRMQFSRALVERLDRLYSRKNPDGFAIHVHAPWGAGKSSVLKMMRKIMREEQRLLSDGKAAPRWIGVEFNAWQHSHRNPPWWPLIEHVKCRCVAELKEVPHKLRLRLPSILQHCGLRGVRPNWYLLTQGHRFFKDDQRARVLEVRWLWWKLKTDALPWALAVIACLVVIYVFQYVKSAGGTANSWIFGAATAVISAYAAFYSASRTALFGSSDSAKYLDTASQDPLRAMKKLFASLARGTGRPICVFIDDLDRCRADYVVSLLEGIQTSFRHENVAYVVAADRAWIKASFEDRYSSFRADVSTEAQPLGYLFLEKLFQVSTPIPGIGASKKSYLDELLLGRQASEAIPTFGTTDDKVAQERRDIRNQLDNAPLTTEEAEKQLAKNDTPVRRAALALELNTSPAVEEQAKHLLSEFSEIFGENPRVIKRTINAYALRQAMDLLSDVRVEPKALARWTILEQRYPVLADLLIDHPEWIEYFAVSAETKPLIAPDAKLAPFISNNSILQIVGSVEAASNLTPGVVTTIVRGLQP